MASSRWPTPRTRDSAAGALRWRRARLADFAGGPKVLAALIAWNVGNYLFFLAAGRFLGPADFGLAAALLAVTVIISVPGNALQYGIAHSVAAPMHVGEGTPSAIYRRAWRRSLFTSAMGESPRNVARLALEPGNAQSLDSTRDYVNFRGPIPLKSTNERAPLATFGPNSLTVNVQIGIHAKFLVRWAGGQGPQSEPGGACRVAADGAAPRTEPGDPTPGGGGSGRPTRAATSSSAAPAPSATAPPARCSSSRWHDWGRTPAPPAIREWPRAASRRDRA